MLQGLCKFDSINKSLASNILDYGVVSNVTIVLHCLTLISLPWS